MIYLPHKEHEELTTLLTLLKSMIGGNHEQAKHALLTAREQLSVFMTDETYAELIRGLDFLKRLLPKYDTDDRDIEILKSVREALRQNYRINHFAEGVFMKVYCEQCDREWQEGGNLTKEILVDFARGHARNHRHTVTVTKEHPNETEGETKQGQHEQPH